MKRLAGKTAIVTGAASGIGAATVQLFAAEGARVLAVDRPESPIGEVHAGRPDVVTLAKNVTNQDAPQAILDRAISAFGSIDILFNNAGVVKYTLAAETTDADWDWQMDVNARAVFRTCRAATPYLRQRAAQTGRARIINTSSVMAFDTDIGLAAYTASKHAVAGLTKTLALELGRDKITANYVLPGAIYSSMTRENFDQDQIRKVWEKKAALRRLGFPIDIARAVLLLASDDADFITGHGLVVDGGLTLRT